ncbi:MAG TPA: regulatory protein GemA [Aliidongia sp.]|uniref:regulatory protein GemA n=1 Tax=Aliidongia sp. TaxID=1914230 RepID=UPI002DDDBBC2|nr:regulatory protein GemA [Aliidongia sp.]HEV2675528.1 regulatory protein GemA [Aliidongia sp.]
MNAVDPTRQAELAKIHVAKKELALADDSYRAIIGRFSAGRTDSSAKLSPRERHAVLDHFETLGFKPSARAPAADRRVDTRPQAQKLKNLWQALWEMGAVYEPSDQALAAFVCRHTSIAALRWNSAADLKVAIDCLKGWCRRVGYSAQPFHGRRPTLGEGRYEPVLIEAQWARLVKLDAVKAGEQASLATWMGNEGFRVRAPEDLDRDDGPEIVSRLGKWLRRVSRGKPEISDGPDD